MLAKLTSDYAGVNGIKLHYVSAGQGKPIMFVHGFPEFWYQWKDQLSEFSQDYRVVAPDLRGYNLSSKPAEIEQYRLDYLLNDLVGLADYLGWSKFSLVGHDWGGYLAWWLGIKHPERLEKLIIINAPHPAIFQRELSSNPHQQQASQYMQRLRHPQAEALLSADHFAALDKLVIAPGLEKGYFDETDRQAYLAAWGQEGAITGGLNYYRANQFERSDESGGSLPPANPAINVPTLVIWGENDSVFDLANLDGLEDYVPDLQVKRISDGTHAVIHEYPALVNRYLREFLEAN